MYIKKRIRLAQGECRFCRRIKDTLVIMEKQELTITNGYFKPLLLIIDLTLKKFYVYDDDQELEITYCPLCGKNLKEILGEKL